MNFDKALLQISDITHGRIPRPQTFGNFMKYCALLLSLRTDPVHAKERTKALEELKINYKDKEWNAFYQTLVDLSSVFVHNTHLGIYQDVLTAPFVQIGAASRTLKQNFSPASIGRIIGAVTIPTPLLLPDEGFFSLGDNACGSGTLLLTGAQRFADAGYNPSEQLVIHAADLDARCVHMTYLHLSLYGIPAVIVHGNTATLDEYDRWYTPAYLWKKWIWRAPMPFGKSGYVSDEMLKCFDEPMYGAYRYMEHQFSTADVNAADKQKQHEK